MGIVKEFKEFAMRGNVIDMAVGIIIGASFGKIVSSAVNDLLMPPIGKMVGGVNFSDLFINLDATKTAPGGGPLTSLAQAKDAGAAVIAYGQFLNVMIDFLIVAFSVFLLVKAINTLRKMSGADNGTTPTTKDCPYCQMGISLKATRCPHCTSELSGRETARAAV